MAKVTTIPATISRFTAVPINEKKKRRTAAYARVSTDSEEQLTSYAAQVDYYTNYIKGRDDWEFVAVYTDEGITGTNTKHREGFKRMVADALDGKIDLIVTKSVSRFARNTVDSLTTVRQLKEKGVEIYFEKENIWTLDSKGELLITIMSSLAQEESRSISENCTWGQRKRFADGKVTVPFKRFLGYDRGPDGNLVLNPEEAVIVQRIDSRLDWTFAGLYVDNGISGTRTEHRKGFKQMMQDALDGKIDLIVTKSISRFARNTVDSLSAIRQLKEHGVEIFFEKENIWTFDSKGELMLTILSSVAQEESRSISKNITWGKRKRFADGEYSIPYSRFLGYDRGMVINPSEAKIIKSIYFGSPYA